MLLEYWGKIIMHYEGRWKLSLPPILGYFSTFRVWKVNVKLAKTYLVFVLIPYLVWWLVCLYNSVWYIEHTVQKCCHYWTQPLVKWIWRERNTFWPNILRKWESSVLSTSSKFLTLSCPHWFSPTLTELHRNTRTYFLQNNHLVFVFIRIKIKNKNYHFY